MIEALDATENPIVIGETYGYSQIEKVLIKMWKIIKNNKFLNN